MTKKSALYSGLIFGIFMTVFSCFMNGWLSGLIAGPLSGLSFGAMMYWFSNSKMLNRQMEIEEDNSGSVLFKGPANHFLHGEGVGGRLYLLHDKLRFKSHKFNIQNHELLLNLNSIKEISFYSPLGIAPTGLKITTKEGKTEKFVVNKRQQWKDEIVKLEGLDQLSKSTSYNNY